MTPSDTVSLSNQVTYADGVFTLTGTASSAAGVTGVEISAQVDGVAIDLGAATVDANGNFSFRDLIGAHTQSFFAATETDGANGTATSADPGFSLTGGLGAQGDAGRQTRYNVDGSAETAVTLFGSDGSESVAVLAPNQTIDLQPYDIVENHKQAGTSFVFSQGDGLDVIHGFKLGGAGHDTIELPSSDFTNFADVLRHTGDVGGSAFITDPKTVDAIRFAGVTTAELRQQPKDFAFVG